MEKRCCILILKKRPLAQALHVHVLSATRAAPPFCQMNPIGRSPCERVSGVMVIRSTCTNHRHQVTHDAPKSADEIHRIGLVASFGDHTRLYRGRNAYNTVGRCNFDFEIASNSGSSYQAVSHVLRASKMMSKVGGLSYHASAPRQIVMFFHLVNKQIMSKKNSVIEQNLLNTMSFATDFLIRCYRLLVSLTSRSKMSYCSTCQPSHNRRQRRDVQSLPYHYFTDSFPFLKEIDQREIDQIAQHYFEHVV